MTNELLGAPELVTRIRPQCTLERKGLHKAGRLVERDHR